MIIAAECEFDSNAKAFDGHYGDGANEGTDGYVDRGIGATIYGDDDVYHNEGDDEDSENV